MESFAPLNIPGYALNSGMHVRSLLCGTKVIEGRCREARRGPITPAVHHGFTI